MITKIKTETYGNWKELRGKYIGGSDCASVIGLNPYKSAYSLWAEKTGKIPPFEGNLTTDVGTYLEEFIAKRFEQETGKKVRRENQSILNDEYPWAIANIDRSIVGEDALLECKSTSELNLKKYRNGEYPPRFYCQVMHYLAVTGKKKAYLAVLIGNKDFKIFEIERDEAEIVALMEEERCFWELVKRDEPPVADGMASTSEALTALYPQSNAETIDLFGCENDLTQYMSISAEIKRLEDLKNWYANKVKAYLGEAGKGENEHFRVSWITSERKTFDAKRFALDHADLNLDAYYKVSSTRTFRVTEKN